MTTKLPKCITVSAKSVPDLAVQINELFDHGGLALAADPQVVVMDGEVHAVLFVVAAPVGESAYGEGYGKWWA